MFGKLPIRSPFNISVILIKTNPITNAPIDQKKNSIGLNRGKSSSIPKSDAKTINGEKNIKGNEHINRT